jgi:hypothetical protein
MEQDPWGWGLAQAAGEDGVLDMEPMAHHTGSRAITAAGTRDPVTMVAGAQASAGGVVASGAGVGVLAEALASAGVVGSAADLGAVVPGARDRDGGDEALSALFG